MEFTLAEAATILDPPVTEQQLRAIVVALDVKPAGKRHINPRGRPVRTYDWEQLAELHKVLLPFLSIPSA